MTGSFDQWRILLYGIDNSPIYRSSPITKSLHRTIDVLIVCDLCSVDAGLTVCVAAQQIAHEKDTYYMTQI